MATSKLPHVFVPVPENIIALAQNRPATVFLNLRPEQRPTPATDDEREFRRKTFCSDGMFIHYPVARFLKSITEPLKTVIFYQGYEEQNCTVIVEIKPVVCWADVEYPRLDFEKPKNWNHHPNFLGTLILALAYVKDTTLTEVIDDPEGLAFVNLVHVFGWPRRLPDAIAS